VLGSRAIGIGGCNGEATLIINGNVRCEGLGKKVAALKVHLIDEAVLSYFLNECS